MEAVNETLPSRTPTPAEKDPADPVQQNEDFTTPGAGGVPSPEPQHPIQRMSATTYPETVPQSFPEPEPVYNCARCSHYLQPGSLACPECQTLAYGPHLNHLAASAASLEKEGNLSQARERWTEALTWLPADAHQANQIHQHLATLDTRQKTADDKRARWTKKLGPFAPILLGAAKFKSAFFLLFKLKFLLGFVSFFGLYWVLFGWKFAAGFMLSILIHEMGHYIAIRSRGLKADLPAFAFGRAYVRWYNEGLSLAAIASIALAGPFAGLLAALAFGSLYLWTHLAIFSALTYASAWLNLFNMIPVFNFDGAQATYALDRLQRGLLLAACIILFALMHEGVFLFIGAGMTYRMFTRDEPETGSPATLAAYLALFFALGAILYFVPNAGSLAR